MEEESDRGGVAGHLNEPSIGKAGMEEEAAEGIEAAFAMEVEGVKGGEGEEGGGGTHRALEALEFPT